MFLAACLRCVVVVRSDLAIADVSARVVQTIACVIQRTHSGFNPQLTLEIQQLFSRARTSLLRLDLLVPMLCEGLILHFVFIVLQELLSDQWLACHGSV